MDQFIAARVQSQRWYERMPRALPAAAFAIAIIATLSFVAYNEHREAERRQGQTRAVASVIASTLARRINTHTAYLRSVAVLLNARNTFNQRDFDALAHELSDDDEYRGSEGISWAQVVPRADLAAFQAARHAEGITDFTLHPAPVAADQPMVIPITYLGNPSPRMRLAYGYDTYSETMRRTAMDDALRYRRPTATGPVRLEMDKGRPAWPGFLIYMPVFDGHSRKLRGFLGAPFNAGAFLNSARDMDPVQNFAVALYDGTAAPAHLLARAGPVGPIAGAFTLPLVVAHRPMSLLVSPPAAGVLSQVSWIALALGSTVALLIGAVAWMVTTQAAKDRAALSWLREQASIRGTLSRELNHRVKNTLANVLSIITLTRRRASNLDDFADALDGRIRALSATHDLLIASDWGPTPLRAIISAELAPYTRGSDGVVCLDGPDVDLAPNDALSLGLALHELATNASKYGALSVETGRITMHWALVEPDRLHVEWIESGGPKVPPQRRRGFGTELIERIVAHELGEPVNLHFAEIGLRCTLMIPVRLPAHFRFRAQAARQGAIAG